MGSIPIVSTEWFPIHGIISMMTNSDVSAVDSSRRWWLICAAPVVTGLVLVMARPGISIDWFFDEAWRADMVRSSLGFERYFVHNTPTAPGWVALHQLLFSVIPPTRQVLRLVAVLPAIPAWLIIGDIIRSKLFDRLGALGSGVVALTTISLVLMQPGDAHLVSYFNNYSMETLFTALVLWAGTHADVRIAAKVLIGLAIVGPWMVQAPLMLLIAVVPFVWVRSDRTERRLLSIGAVCAGLSLAVTYLVFLRPVANREIPGLASITGYWESETYQAAGFLGAGKLVIRTMMFAVLPQQLEWTLIGWLLIAIGGAVGLVTMWSICRLWVFAIPLTQFQILVASLLVGWPISFTRVNHAVGLLVTILIPLGLSLVIWWVARQVPKVSVGVAIAVVVSLAMFVWPSALRDAAGGTGVFARGLSDDMDVLAPQLSDGDVVLGYHSMSSWYIHDRLVTDSSTPVILLDELEFGVILQREPELLINDYARKAMTAWCVMPYELGDLLLEQCELSDEWELVGIQFMSRAEVRQWIRHSVD